MTWTPVAVLANVHLQNPIGNKIATLVRARDRICQQRLHVAPQVDACWRERGSPPRSWAGYFFRRALIPFTHVSNATMSLSNSSGAGTGVRAAAAWS